MRFAAIEALDLRCVYGGYEPGELHTDGRRYLPTHRLATVAAQAPEGVHGHAAYELPVVDRHHRVAAQAVGAVGHAQLVALLCQFRLQSGERQQGFAPQLGGIPGAPLVHGCVTHVAVWEVAETPLPYESLYCEYVIDVGVGTMGVRTHATAPSLAALIGTDRICVGDWVTIRRPRIDILGYTAG